MDYIRLRGTGVSPGIAIAEVYLTERVVFAVREETIAPDRVPAEKDRGSPFRNDGLRAA